MAGWRGPPTSRQMTTWRVWLDMEWNRPSRADWYAMQTAATVLRGVEMTHKGVTPEQIREANFRLAFSAEASPVIADKAEADEEEYQRNIMEISKAQAMMRRGKRIVVEDASPVVKDEIVIEQPDLAVDDATLLSLGAMINADAKKEE